MSEWGRAFMAKLIRAYRVTILGPKLDRARVENDKAASRLDAAVREVLKK